MIVAIIVLLIIVVVLLLGVIGMKTQLEDVRLLARTAKKDHAEKELWLQERLDEERERNRELLARLEPFAAHVPAWGDPE